MKEKDNEKSQSRSGDGEGFVYVYNLTRWRISPTLNGNLLDEIPALSISLPGRQPGSLPVRRVNGRETSDPAFADFSQLRLRYLGKEGSDFEAEVAIPRRVFPLALDLQMVVCYDFLVVTFDGELVTLVISPAAFRPTSSYRDLVSPRIKPNSTTADS